MLSRNVRAASAYNDETDMPRRLASALYHSCKAGSTLMRNEARRIRAGLRPAPLRVPPWVDFFMLKTRIADTCSLAQRITLIIERGVISGKWAMRVRLGVSGIIPIPAGVWTADGSQCALLSVENGMIHFCVTFAFHDILSFVLNLDSIIHQIKMSVK